MSKWKRERIGWAVRDHCEDHEQFLSLVEGDGRPSGGLLEWREESMKVAVFLSRSDARAAITRTEHYRLAYGSGHPERRWMSIVPFEVVRPVEGA
jgi:hypothetical protein